MSTILRFADADPQLIALSYKLLVNPLQNLCTHFLLTHASGKPITAMSIAEEYSNAELYREASRFVLDQRTFVLYSAVRELSS